MARVSIRSGRILLLLGFLSGSTATHAATDCTTPLQTYYVPFPAEQVKVWADDLANDNTNTDFIKSVQSITITQNATVICYDHWEDGFEDDLRFPVTIASGGTSQIWGDGNAVNGCAPGPPACTNANDVLNKGRIVSIESSVPANPRGTSILLDGQDKFTASHPVKLSRAAWPDDASTTNTGAQLGGSVEVYDTNRWGSSFVSPVGENIATNAAAWEWVALTVMSRTDGTRLTVDLDGDGNPEYDGIPLDEGRSILIQDILVGATVTATAPVQATIVTADVDSNYQGRWFSLVPRSDWDNNYYAPMPQMGNGADGHGNGNTKVHLFNPNASAITVNVDHLHTRFDTTVNVPARSLVDYQMPCMAVQNPCGTMNVIAGRIDVNGVGGVTTADDGQVDLYTVIDGYLDMNGSGTITTADVGTFRGMNVIVSGGLGGQIDVDGSGTITAADATTLIHRTAARFYTNLESQPFFAVSTVDAPDQIYDWGYSLVEENNLSTDLVVGWAKGSTNLATNVSPLWVTTTAQTTLQVDFDGNGTTDQTIPLQPLQVARILDTSDNDQTGIVVKTIPSTKITGVWGQDPDPGSSGQPTQLDMGNVIVPTPVLVLQKVDELSLDLDGNGAIDPGDVVRYTIRVFNNGDQDLPVPPATTVRIFDNLVPGVTYRAGTTTVQRCAAYAANCTPTVTSVIPDQASPASLFPLDCAVADCSSGSDVGFDLGTLGVHETAVLSFQVVIDAAYAASTVTNTSTAISGSTQSSTSTATSPVSTGGLTITKTSSVPGGTVDPGERIDYTVTVANTGRQVHRNVVVYDAVPSGTTYLNSATNLSTRMTQTISTTVMVRDDFNRLYAGSDGPNPWQTDWIEAETSGAGPAAGEVRVVAGRLRFNNSLGGSDTPMISREVDLDGCSAATLQYDYATSAGTDANDTFQVYCGAGATGALGTQLQSVDLGSNASGTSPLLVLPPACRNDQTAIRFRLAGSGDFSAADELMFVDNVRVVATGCPGIKVKDLFDDVNYANQDGTDLWGTDWTEVNDDNAAATGDLRVDPGSFLVVTNNGGGALPSIARSVDLSGCTAATFTFRLIDAGSLDGNDCIEAEVGNAGPTGAFNAAELVQICNDVNSLTTFGPYNLHTAVTLNQQVAVRFRVQSNMNDSDDVYHVHDARIQATGCARTRTNYAPATTPALADGDPTGTPSATNGLVVTNDRIDLGPNDYLTITYSVTAANPLEDVDAGIFNLATTRSDQQRAITAYTLDPVAASVRDGGIGDRVWLDLDGDGVQDVGEPGIANAIVELRNGVCTPLPAGGANCPTTRTDISGLYHFGNLQPGNYTVAVIVSSLPNGGTGLATSPGTANPTATIALAPGQIVTDADFGFRPSSPTTALVGDRVWSDFDGDGVQDPGEAGIGGVTVQLRTAGADGVLGTADDPVVATRTTAADGGYLFSGVAPGAYTVSVLTSTLPGGGAGYTLTAGPQSQGNPHVPFTVQAGDAYVQADFGFRRTTTRSITDRLWHDADEDRILDPGERPFAGVSVALLGAGGTVVATTTSGADGSFTFSGLENGTYTIRVTDAAGVLERWDGTTGFATAGQRTGLVLAGVDLVNTSFGYNARGSVGDTIYNDSNQNGVQDPGEVGIEGVVVELRNGICVPLPAGGANCPTRVTGPDGSYLFTGLLPRQYQTHVNLAQPALSGYAQTADPDVKGAPCGGFCDAFGTALVAVRGNDLTLDYGFRRDFPDVSGTVFEDLDRNALQAPAGENGFAGVTLELVASWRVIDGRIDIDGDGDVDTDDDGWAAGIRVIDGRLDLDGNGSITGADAGTWRRITVIAGELDLNGVGGVTGADDGTVRSDAIARTTTDANGDYTFFDVPGTAFGRDYTVVVTDVARILEGYQLTTGIDRFPVTVRTTNVTDVDFGYVRGGRTGSIGDTVWIDVDPPGPAGPDGIRGPSEAGIPGVVLRLFRDVDGDGIPEPTGDDAAGLVATTRTDADGNYRFVGLPAGRYFVDLDASTLPAGLVATVGTTDPSRVVSLSEGQDFRDADFGWLPAPGTVVLGDRIWFDADADGLQDPGELGIPGIDVIVIGDGPDDTNNGPAYRIFAERVDIDSDGDADAADNGFTSEGIRVIGGLLDLSNNGSIGPEDDSATFGTWRGRAVFDGFVDLDGDGPDGNDGGILPRGDDIAFVTTTGANGIYLFTGLPPDFYTLIFDRTDVAARGHGTTPTNIGPNTSYLVTAAAGDVLTFLDWGFTGGSFGTIGDRVWLDLDGDGVQDAGERGIAGVTLDLVRVADGVVLATTTTGTWSVIDGRLDLDGNGIVNGQDDGSVSGTRVIDGRLDLSGNGTIGAEDDSGTFGNWNGYPVIAGEIDLNGGGVSSTDDGRVAGDYAFQGLTLGAAYQVVVTDRAGVLAGLSATAAPGALTPTGGTPVLRTADFGFAPAAGAGSIGTTVWHDLAGFGVRNPGEPPIEGVTLAIWVDVDGNGAITPGVDDLLRSATTDTNGEYELLGLPYGRYLVQVTDRNGVVSAFTRTTGAVGVDDNSQANPYPVTLSSSTPNVVTADFGFRADTVDPAAISGTVFFDEDANGLFADPLEPIVAGARLRLYRRLANGQRKLIGTTLSDVNGDYLFTDLAAGDYEVEVDVRGTGAQDTLQTTQTATAGVQRVLGLVTGATSIGNDFGFYDAGVTTTPVTLGWFRASSLGGDSVRFEWTTLTEVGTVGFDLWAWSGDDWRRLTDDLVFSAQGDSLELQRYRIDLDGVPETSFLLSELDILGTTRVHGPFDRDRDHGRRRIAADPIDWPAIRAEHEAGAARRRAARSHEPVTALYLRTVEAGIHEVRFEDLLAAGLDLSGVDPDDVALLQRGEPVPVEVSGGPLGPGSTIRWVAERLETLYTRTNAYLLTVDPALALAAGSSPTPFAGGPADETRDTVRFGRDLVYSFASPNGDPWYDTRIVRSSPGGPSFPLALAHRAGGPVDLAVDVYGGINWPGAADDHHVVLEVNGVRVAATRFDGLVGRRIEAEVPESILLAANNQLRILLPVDTGQTADIVHFEAFTTTYRRRLVATGDRLTFSGDGVFRVDGLTSPDVVAWRVADGVAERVEPRAVTPGAGGWSVVLGADEPATFHVATRAALRRPSLAPIVVPDDLEVGPAGLLVLTHAGFADALPPLVAAREAQGWSVKVVDVADLYAAYGHGIFGPDAIRDYVALAVHQLGTRAVLLVGGDTYDYLNFLGTGGISFVPSPYTATGSIVRFAPADTLYVDLDGDDVPELPIGRLPARTLAEAHNLVAKILAFETRPDREEALFVADDVDYGSGFDFRLATEQIAFRVPESWSLERVLLDEAPVSASRAALLAGLHAGPALVSYMGHSGPTVWTFDGLFAAADAQTLTNVGRPSLVMQWGCWTTYYPLPAANTLAHRFLLTPDVGAAAIVGATTLTEARSERALALALADRLFLPGQTLGKAITDAKRRLAALGDPATRDVLVGWTLLGDPTMPALGPAGPALCEGDPATGDGDADGVCGDLDACFGFDPLGDADGDGFCDDLDECPGDDRADADGDGVCDGLDACAAGDDRLDGDADGVADACDQCLGDDALGDADGDGICGSANPCLPGSGPDGDGDGVPDACDLCLGDDALGDLDGDGICGASRSLFRDGFESGDTARWETPRAPGAP